MITNVNDPRCNPIEIFKLYRAVWGGGHKYNTNRQNEHDFTHLELNWWLCKQNNITEINSDDAILLIQIWTELGLIKVVREMLKTYGKEDYTNKVWSFTGKEL